MDIDYKICQLTTLDVLKKESGCRYPCGECVECGYLKTLDEMAQIRDDIEEADRIHKLNQYKVALYKIR